jgi:hypothetical protein
MKQTHRTAVWDRFLFVLQYREERDKSEEEFIEAI